MKTVYIHIGTMKTGTSAIQEFLGINKEAIEKQGYCYPLMNIKFKNESYWNKYKYRNGQFLIHNSSLPTKEKNLKKSNDIWQKGFKIIQKKAKNFNNIIISEELLWHKQNKNLWNRIKTSLEKIGFDFKVIVYLRRQDIFIQSFWNQRVKGDPRMSISFDEYIKSGKYFNESKINYLKILNNMSNWIGRERIIVRPFEKCQFEGEDNSIISDFFHCIGLKFNNQFLFNSKDVNPGLSDNYIEIKRISNEVDLCHDTSDFMRYASQIIYQKDFKNGKLKKTSMFSYDEQCQFLLKFREDNTIIAKEYLNRDDGILFYEKIELLPKWKLNEEDIYRNIIQIFAAVEARHEIKIKELENETAEKVAQKK